MLEKLVRDRIPDLIVSEGKTPLYRIALSDEMQTLLKNKLYEEVEELITKPSAEEVGDVLEVLHAICDCLQIEWQEVERMRLSKRSTRGAFHDRIVLQGISTTDRGK